jgi:hypothetical protein
VEAQVALGRRIEAVSAAEVIALDAAGALPVDHRAPAPGQRRPTRDEWSALSWLVEWDGRRVAGVAAYRDLYDYHGARDAREIVTVQGTPRAATELVRAIIGAALSEGRSCIGAVDAENVGMRRFLAKQGVATRCLFEALP